MVNYVRGNFLIFTMSMLFLFSVGYTIIFYFNQAQSLTTPQNSLTPVVQTTNQAPTDQSILSAITSGFVDDILGFLSIINPFGFIILLVKAISPQDAYQFLDLLFLRPIGWTGTIITSNYIISKIRGTEE